MTYRTERFALADGRLRVPARVLRAIGLYGGGAAYVVRAEGGGAGIHAQPPRRGGAKRMTVDEHGNLLLRVGKANAGLGYVFRAEAGAVVVAPSCPCDVADRDGRTPLMDAARAGDLGRVGELLTLGAYANRQDRQGWTALHWAAAHAGNGSDPECQRQAEVARLLLLRGASPDLGDEGGNTALIMVAAIGDEATVRALLEGRANPNVRNHEDRTAWDFAREEEALPVLAALREFGAEPRW